MAPTVPTLAALLTQPPWSHSTVLAGGASMGQPITEVRLETDLGALRASTGTLVVMVSQVTPSDWRLDAAMRRLADDGAAGLVLRGRHHLLRGSVALSERLGVPVLGTEEDPAVLAMATRQRLTAPEVERSGYLSSAHRLLSRRVLAPAELADAVGNLLEARVWVLTGEGGGLAGEPAPAPGFRPGASIVQRCRSTDGVSVMLPVTDRHGHHPELWLGAALGHEDHEWEWTVREVLEVAALSLRCWRAERRVEVERDARARATVLAELLRVEGEPAAELRNRASEFGWRLEGWHLGFRIGVPQEMDVLGTTPELASALGVGVSGTEGETGVAALVETHGGWSGWVTTEREPDRGTVDRIVNRLRRVQRSHSVLGASHIGVGRAHPGAAGIATTLGEAADAARLAVNRREVGRFLHIDRLGMAQLLLAWTRTDTFQPAARELLAPLSRHSEELVPTLAAYLDAESNLTETAAVLGVHRNTVAARIARIERLLGVDFGNADERLALHLAVRTVLSES